MYGIIKRTVFTCEHVSNDDGESVSMFTKIDGGRHNVEVQCRRESGTEDYVLIFPSQ